MAKQNKDPDILLDGLRKSLLRLIPESRAEILYGSEVAPFAAAAHFVSVGAASAGAAFETHRFTLCLKVPSRSDTAIQVQRDIIPFSKAERKLLSSVPQSIAALITLSDNHGHAMAQKLSAAFGHDHILIARVLRGVTSGTYFTPAITLRLLQNLTFLRYESQPATSGILYSSQPELYLPALDASRFSYSAFATPQPLTIAFFEKPASYRYVDGKNAFYFVDNRRQVLGTIRLRKASNWSFPDRSVN